MTARHQRRTIDHSKKQTDNDRRDPIKANRDKPMKRISRKLRQFHDNRYRFHLQAVSTFGFKIDLASVDDEIIEQSLNLS